MTSSLKQLESYIHQYESEGNRKKGIQRESFSVGSNVTKPQTIYAPSSSQFLSSSARSSSISVSGVENNASVLITLEGFLTKLDNFRTFRAYRMKQLQQDCLKDFDLENEFGESVFLCNNEEKEITEEEYETLLFGGSDESSDNLKGYENQLQNSFAGKRIADNRISTDLNSSQASILLKAEWDIPHLSNGGANHRLQYLRDSLKNALHSRPSAQLNPTQSSFSFNSSIESTAEELKSFAVLSNRMKMSHAIDKKPPMHSQLTRSLESSIPLSKQFLQENHHSVKGISFELPATNNSSANGEEIYQPHAQHTNNQFNELTAYLDNSSSGNEDINHQHSSSDEEDEGGESIQSSQFTEGGTSRNPRYLTEFSFLSDDAQRWLADDDEVDDCEVSNNNDVMISSVKENTLSRSFPAGKQKEDSISSMRKSLKGKELNKYDESVVLDRLNRVLFTSSMNPNRSVLETTTNTSPSKQRKPLQRLLSVNKSPKPITPNKIPDFND